VREICEERADESDVHGPESRAFARPRRWAAQGPVMDFVRVVREIALGRIERLRREIGETAGNVWIYRLCENCWEASVGVGEIAKTIDSEPCVIV